MSVAALMDDLDRLGVHLEAHGGKLRYRPRSRVSAELAGRLLTYKSELLAILPPEAAAITPAGNSRMPRRFRSSIRSTGSQVDNRLSAAYNSRMLIHARDILDTAQVAGLLGLSVVRVQQFCRQGRIGTMVGGRYLITRREVACFARIARPAGNPQFRAPKK